MSPKDWLEVLAALAAVITAMIAIFAYGMYRYERWAKRRKLESFLQEAWANDFKRPIPALDLVAELRMSEAEIIDASFRSTKIRLIANMGGPIQSYDGLTFRYDASTTGTKPAGGPPKAERGHQQ